MREDILDKVLKVLNTREKSCLGAIRILFQLFAVSSVLAFESLPVIISVSWRVCLLLYVLYDLLELTHNL